jgi:AcrR family transcriptional regulator
MPDDEGTRSPRGRPRDPSIDERVLKATAELLAAKGYAGTSVQEVGRRAGVPASAIYRRWSSRVRLIEDAAYPGPGQVAAEPTGDLGADLTLLLEGLLEILTRPAARAAVPGLMVAYQSEGRWPSVDRFSPVSSRPQLRRILAAAGPDQVDPEVDPDAVFDLMLGSILVHSFVPTPDAGQRDTASIVELLCRMLRRP